MSDKRIKTTLRREDSRNLSGHLLNEGKIEILKEKDYYVKEWPLDGDAPKQFIKAYVFEKDSGIRRKNPNTWWPFIAKSAEKWYPHESVIEHMINRIGQEMGMIMNDVKLVKANGQVRFLSRYFLKSDETLNHGAEICGQHLGDMEMADDIAQDKNTARYLFTFEFIKESIEAVYPLNHESILKSLVSMIAFDGLVGNNDRHFYNWGVIDTKKKNQKPPRFAPLYDSARGLLWNLSDENIVHYYNVHNQNGKKIDKYIENACPRISLENNKKANHFDLIKFVKESNESYAEIISRLASREKEKKVLEMLGSEFYRHFIPERCELIELILKIRFERVRNI
ncbi:HipA domain-containing protein [Fulvivirgaceae bacterium BMA12]|uniref:HipA domain-containing protein n=1 Tax=Agaribacillus aureus TaxID=3051825 RepID=A0ABT8LGL0_9BACT|nr:HipA domain-containing protein [Fulvivirgaceae bacterium BMA12]